MLRTGDALQLAAALVWTFGHYLRLRKDPEPALLPKVERVRAEFARLTRERN